MTGHSFTLSVINGLAQHQGTLRLSLGNLQGYIHQENSNHWKRQEATVACRFKAFAYNHFGRKTGWRLISSVSCLGNERVLGQCAMNYGQGEMISTEFQGVICTGMDDYAVRLSDGQYDRGRVEISIGGTWGSVSSSSVWSSGKNAQVICTQLGFHSGVAITNGTYLRGLGPVWIRDLNCAGHERSIRDCSFTINGTDLYSRSSTPDVGVICLNQRFTQVTSSTKILRSSQTSQENVPTTENVLKPNNTTEGNEETSDETDKEEEITSDNTGLFVGISVAALSVVFFIVLVICWKLRSTDKKDASLSTDVRKKSDTHKGQQSSNDLEQAEQKDVNVQRQDNPAYMQDKRGYSSESCPHNNCIPGMDLIQFPVQERLYSTVSSNSSSFAIVTPVLDC
ncbi:soluble scavenger receptor cysteine-rich domain-containing protein SSC5D-like [Saccostrea cucullata]|uniref:soluble scavenger receptor cysteine-rich domain-containing protein SSC5D-like n=1 Tax=Saccostrea cuccullata TaxID=36930 RepID=UPI002ED5270A